MRVLLVAVLFLPGCVTELLEDDPATTRHIACGALGQVPMLAISIEEADASLPLGAGIHALVSTLDDVAGRSPVTVRIDSVVRGATDPLAWAESLTVLTRNEVRLYVLVVPDLPAAGDTMLRLKPSVWAVSAEAVRAGAEAAGMDLETAAGAVFMHLAGHAFGVVNRGIPIADANLTGREGPMHHEPTAGSVLHVGWHHRSTMPKSQTVPLEYSPGVRGDWQAALTGVCA